MSKMKIPVIFFGVVFIFFLNNCKSPADKIVDDFNKVNEELQKANEIMDSTAKDLTFYGLNKKEADSILLILKNVSDFLEKIKAELAEAEPDEENMDVAEKLLNKTAKGDSLFHLMMSVYGLAIKFSTDSLVKQQYIHLLENDKDKWQEKYFKMVPVIAAKTILSKFQNDCRLIRMNSAGAGSATVNNQALNQ